MEYQRPIIKTWTRYAYHEIKKIIHLHLINLKDKIIKCDHEMNYIDSIDLDKKTLTEIGKV